MPECLIAIGSPKRPVPILPFNICIATCQFLKIKFINYYFLSFPIFIFEVDLKDTLLKGKPHWIVKKQNISITKLMRFNHRKQSCGKSF